MDGSDFIALAGVLISLWTLYATQIGRAKADVEIGPVIKIYYPSDGGFAAYIPSTYINYGARMAVISAVRIVLARTDDPEQQFSIAWDSFSKYDGPTGGWVYEEVVHALAVPARGALHKLVWFCWSSHSTPPLQIKAGEYEVRYLCWVAGQRRPQSRKFRFSVSGDEQRLLDVYRAEKNSSVVDIRISGGERNRVLSRRESDAMGRQ